MGHPQKKQHCQPSIIDSDLDHHFSLSGSGSNSDTTLHESDIVVQESQPIVLPQKCAKPASAYVDAIFMSQWMAQNTMLMTEQS